MDFAILAIISASSVLIIFCVLPVKIKELSLFKIYTLSFLTRSFKMVSFKDKTFIWVYIMPIHSFELGLYTG